MNIDLKDYICFKVMTPNDLEDERKAAHREMLRKKKIKLLIQQARERLKLNRCDKKAIDSCLKYAIEVLEMK